MDNIGSQMISGPETKGVSRRDFIKVCSVAAAAVGLPAWAGEKMAENVGKKKPSVVWLHFQECTGCTESLLRTSHPDVGALILDLVSVDYHETLFAAAGKQIEEALESAKKAGGYVLVVEGAIPKKDDGIYCMVGGKTAVDSLVECAEKAAAVICIGSCSSWGGVPSAAPNPTQAVGAPEILREKGIKKPVVTLPGCPANPYNLLGTVLQFATFGTLPKLDEKGRPAFAYGRVIHEDCPRRPHFDAGRFAQAYGDEGHRNGWCLYKIGCKGPQTHANCSLLSFCEVPGAWPIGIGHPCVGCTEQGIVFNVPINQNLPIEHPTAPMAYPAIHPEHGVVGGSPVAVGLGGAVIGALVGAGVVASRKMAAADDADGKE
ncbi:hydrogenase small subunit [Anaeromyxobacter dehalogenans]|uniref:Hydrogenase (NiFe) small subunit (HydA) n=1 Tax=Anaeromyxobacter dehalogenans (strain 2CP-C) TaxID=290397 RepID=Q2IN73_ANADE|nr:hydrogenase small subunit [Anaeromyxobacter dehalogenans]ABC80257.1 hydrogenase (NiFe) small subunit (hydA) [Anaeromyxobacter dehalogenans 2CP-C]